ncbi:MAG: hypothetical protein A2431_01310 [Candidatus Zambryskibacteria bacterium RIFOXYC1_FULL_39_10]|uniref:Uncharacterized protein n=1 Tax=Candidatus Zambryskibacteria bacterium RIFOXYC1_FULL_39_10 TaxID=1802779 RepID=A0A1G2UZC9_9BACT|nr:MAG: hypothetical protein A2431_01310 [Candidatus Zambryskibacteria bacterium RIFOXYC1_FULL_39_10]OHB16591.1 MAG: hypothetical protein A2605_04165 [Candidatus Zambryskibacteria bacterium RIFOXYD1_FULL_39_35]
MITNRNKLIGVVVVLIAIVGLVWFLVKGGGEQQVSRLDAADTVGNFYGEWLTAVKQPETAEPNIKTLAKSPILSKELRDKIRKVQKDSSNTIDPVLCQATIPEEISTRRVSTGEDEVQILITSKDKNVTNQALVTVSKLNEGWYINDIACSLGEFAPEREFSFEKEGFLLKNSIPKPYNPENWHLVFEDNGAQGNVVPLFFDKESQCTSLDGSKSVCVPSQFAEATKVRVRSQMTERGASVKQLEFVK